MKGAALTPIGVMEQLERLLRVYARPGHAPSDSVLFAQTYVEACTDVSSQQFAQAVTEYMRSDARFFPKPGELRAFALKQPGVSSGTSGSVMAWSLAGSIDAAGRLSPCPCCNRAFQWSPRLHVVHNHLAHRRAGEPCIGNCDEPKCMGPGLHSTTPVAESAGELWEPPSARMLALPAPVHERVAIQEEIL